MLVASELLRLPSVDDLTCDAGDDTATIEQNIDDADSLNYTALNDLTRRGAAQDDVDTVVDGKIVWTQQMAQVQFGVVPVVELADFINL